MENENSISKNNPSQDKQLLSKVSGASILFWIILLLATGMGEAASDFLAHPPMLNPVLFLQTSGVVLIITLIAQFLVRKFVPWIYWLNICVMTLFGTIVADIIGDDVLGRDFQKLSLILIVIMAILFIVWYLLDRTLSVESIYTTRREAFYWAIALCTFILGTAVVDTIATPPMNKGFLLTGVMFAVLFVVIALVYKLFGLHKTFAFWFAFIVSRMVGAAFFDWMGGFAQRGNLGWGKGPVSLVAIIIIIALVIFISFKSKTVKTSDTSSSLS